MMTAATPVCPAPRPRQAVILAGGRGTRMRPWTDSAPKHMYPVAGRPFAHWLVEQLAAQGFGEILFLLGYLPEATRAYFGNGERYGVSIRYAATPERWETAARVAEALPGIDPAFLLCYCDNYWPMRALRLWQTWRDSGAAAQLTVYDNADSFTRSNVEVRDGRVVRYDSTRQAPRLAGVDIGYALFDRRSLEPLLRNADASQSFQEAVYPALAAQGRLAAHTTQHRYYGVGHAERLPAAEQFFARRPAVILDRDGVLNRRPPVGEYVCDEHAFEWLPGAREAVARFHRAGYVVVVVTNQAGVARGLVSTEALERIHARMRAEAEQAGGRIDAIYCCPHHWESDCACRKPRPGMLLAAQRDFHLDLTRTWFLGDDERDAGAAAAAGCLYAEAWLSRAALSQEFPSLCVSS